MPRLARLDAPGVLHHIIIRVIKRRTIFKDNKDSDDLIDRLSTLLLKWGHRFQNDFSRSFQIPCRHCI
jgi:hypothetical protein